MLALRSLRTFGIGGAARGSGPPLLSCPVLRAAGSAALTSSLPQTIVVEQDSDGRVPRSQSRAAPRRTHGASRVCPRAVLGPLTPTQGRVLVRKFN